jgi:glycosyltransferase involved in cell wall biosynthesis
MGWEGAVCVAERGELADWLARNSFRYVINPMPWLDLKKPWTGIAAIRLGYWVKRNCIDIIQCNEHQLYPFATILAKLTGVPVVCHVRCKLPSGFARWAFCKREPDALIWCTRHMAAECGPELNGQVHAERQHIVPLGLRLPEIAGVQPSAFKQRVNGGGKQVVIGMACFIRPGKRVEDFLKLAGRLRQSSDARFVLAGGPAKGDEKYFQELQVAIKEHIARGTIEWLGHVDPIDQFFRAIDIFVSTSEHESFGMSVCEAMAFGKPVAAYRGGSVADVVGDSGLIVETGDLDALADAVERLITDRDLRLALAVKARQRVADEFDPAKSFKQLRAIYSSLLGKNNGRCRLQQSHETDR